MTGGSETSMYESNKCNKCEQLLFVVAKRWGGSCVPGLSRLLLHKFGRHGWSGAVVGCGENRLQGKDGRLGRFENREEKGAWFGRTGC